MIYCNNCHSEINIVFKYIIGIIIIIIRIFKDSFFLIRTIRYLSAFLISHYSVNTLFATSTPVFLKIFENADW